MQYRAILEVLRSWLVIMFFITTLLLGPQYLNTLL